MKKLLISAAMLAMAGSAANTQENDPPPPFHPCHKVWQCNDIAVTITGRDRNTVEYDLGGTIWGGAHLPWSRANSSLTSGLVCRGDQQVTDEKAPSWC